MRTATILSLAAGLGMALVVACGGSTDSDSSSTGGAGGSSGAGGASGGSGGSGNTGGIDCSTVGCAPPPRCEQGCTAACGCCMCGEGEKAPVEGGYLLCTGGCFTFVAAKSCGGYGGSSCGADEFCDYPDSSYCGGDDSTGVCTKRPEVCDADCPGVCACDGKFYCNACGANAAGVDVSKDQSCMTGDGGVGKTCASDSECSGGLKCCYPCGIPGCQNQCMQPMPNGMCPMFP